MTIVHRALFTWFIVLVFCIFLCLRLDNRTNWNWFIVFIPHWLFDSILLIYVMIKIITKWRNLTRLKELLISYQWYLTAVLLKIAAQVIICLKLEYPQLELSIYVTMIPIWILLPTIIVYLLVILVRSK